MRRRRRSRKRRRRSSRRGDSTTTINPVVRFTLISPPIVPLDDYNVNDKFNNNDKKDDLYGIVLFLYTAIAQSMKK